MNCPSRVDQDEGHPHWNQNPPALAADLTTRNDLNHIANLRRERGDGSDPDGPDQEEMRAREQLPEVDNGGGVGGGGSGQGKKGKRSKSGVSAGEMLERTVSNTGRRSVARANDGDGSGRSRETGKVKAGMRRVVHVLRKYAKFIGPGFMVSVAYIDPGNYATDVAAGASYRFRLLFVILMSNLFAIFLQSLCVKLGSVTGMNLAENCRAHFPPWLNYVLYFFAESAIIATDIAEVIGTAIALNLLFHLPLVAGCAISIVDVLIILFFYRPSGTMRGLRAFEIFVMLLVLGVVVCFCYQLSLISHTSVGEVFRGYLPSSAIVESKGLFQSCGILGATVMPHSLYLGSGIIQARLREFDDAAGTTTTRESFDDADRDLSKYRPSISAIRSCLSYSIVETAVSLFTFALFVNSAILIVAGASLSNTPNADEADLFSIHDLLSRNLAPVAGTIFALALLLSGTSAGIVCTIAGQMVSEGQLNWTIRPWLRRLITRSISITPSIIIAGAVGKSGLSDALEASQVALSVILPFVSAPLIWFTCRSHVMTVRTVPAPESTADGEVTVVAAGGDEAVNMRNNWFTAVVAILIWLVIVVMNVALLVLAGLGVD